MRLEIQFPKVPACHLDHTLSIYRRTTAAFLRKYFRMSTELGHLPSLLGREFFRTHVTSYHTFSFEDVVIFTHDVERCLERLPKKLQMVIARLVFQEYTITELARMTGYCEKTISRWLGEALDRLAEVFVMYGLLEPIKIANAIQIARELGMLGDSEIPVIEEDEDENETTAGIEFAIPPKKPPLSERWNLVACPENELVNCG